MTEIRPTHWPAVLNEEDDLSDDHYGRLSYGLTYTYEERTFDFVGMYGPDIPNAYNPADPDDTTPGEWCHDVSDCDNDPVYHVLSMAVYEAIHEALEWTRLDGEILLDPHDRKWENDILALSGDVSAKLFELAKRANKEIS